MYDVIVVGAGPAGSTCARGCAKQGLRTLLLDKARFPRPKPCGGALSEQALLYLDFELPREIIEKECLGVRIHFKDDVIEVRDTRKLAVLVSREKFDAFLLEKAKESGAEVLQGEHVVGLDKNHDYAEVITEGNSFKSLCVVGADGINSRVAKYVRPSFAREEKLFAIVSPVAAPNEEIDRRLDRIIDIYFGIVPLGYGWIFPHDGYYCVGIGAIASGFLNPRQVLIDFGKSAGLSIDETHGHFIPLGGIKRRMISHRTILIGDAAGLVDPFTGEGIAYAILSGKLAAMTIANAVRTKDFSEASLFSCEKECNKLIVRDFSYSWSMTRLIHKFPDLFLRLFAVDERILQKYLDVPTLRINHRQFLSWLIVRLPFLTVSSLWKKV